MDMVIFRVTCLQLKACSSRHVQLNFAIPDPTVPEVRQYRMGVVGPDFFSFLLFLILSNNTEFAINRKFGNNR